MIRTVLVILFLSIACVQGKEFTLGDIIFDTPGSFEFSASGTGEEGGSYGIITAKHKGEEFTIRVGVGGLYNMLFYGIHEESDIDNLLYFEQVFGLDHEAVITAFRVNDQIHIEMAYPALNTKLWVITSSGAQIQTLRKIFLEIELRTKS